jgi:ribose 5-phosphate isomerase B
MVAIGADHAGYDIKEKIKAFLKSAGREVKDFGANSPEPVDYPDYAHEVAKSVQSGESELGILVCGSGIGMAMAANRHAGIRAANVESVEAARLSRSHNNANVLSVGARLTPWEVIKEMVTVFLSTPFEGGRHERRVEKIDLPIQQ